MSRDARKTAFEAQGCYNDVLSCPFGVHTSLAATGIPDYRIVYLNTEPNNVGESITDNGTVGYSGTAGATTLVAGVVKYGYQPLEAGTVLLPGINRDENVTVTILGTMMVEVVPGAVIPVGQQLGEDGQGRATAAAGTTGLYALSAATGVGTAKNPEYIVALIK